MSDFKHPDSGRVYREGDPAHHFAELALGLRRMCDTFVYHYDARMLGKDYLSQLDTWNSDPGRMAAHMADTVEQLETAWRKVNAERQAPAFGIGKYDDEWNRKYG